MTTRVRSNDHTRPAIRPHVRAALRPRRAYRVIWLTIVGSVIFERQGSGLILDRHGDGLPAHDLESSSIHESRKLTRTFAAAECALTRTPPVGGPKHLIPSRTIISR
mgnify:CR=1 FL=1